MSNQISSKTEKVKKVHCNFKKVTDSKQLIISEAIKWFEAMISKITFLVQSGKYEFFEVILQCYILETLVYLNFKNPKIYFFLLVLAAVAPLSVNIISSASTTSVTISSASCRPSRNPLFRKKQVTPVIFLSEGDGTRVQWLIFPRHIPEYQSSRVRVSHFPIHLPEYQSSRVTDFRFSAGFEKKGQVGFTPQSAWLSDTEGATCL